MWNGESSKQTLLLLLPSSIHSSIHSEAKDHFFTSISINNRYNNNDDDDVYKQIFIRLYVKNIWNGRRFVIVIFVIVVVVIIIIGVFVVSYYLTLPYWTKLAVTFLFSPRKKMNTKIIIIFEKFNKISVSISRWMQILGKIIAEKKK